MATSNYNTSAIAIRKFSGIEIHQTIDSLVLSNKVEIPIGYVNATQMLQAGTKETGKKKNWSNYIKKDTTIDFLAIVSREINKNRSTSYDVDPVITIGSNALNNERGTWIHPDVAMHLAQWCSPEFSYWASKTLRLIIDGEFQALTPEAQQAQDNLNDIYTRLRKATIDTFWFIAGGIKEYYEINPRVEDYKGQNYSEVMDEINLGLFGKKSKTIKGELGITKGQLNRNHFGEESLKRIEMIQRIGKSQISKGVHPMDAVAMAIDIMGYECIDYKR